MKSKFFLGLMGLVFLVTMGLGSALAADMKQVGPALAVSPAVAALDSKTDIVIMGSGFTPGQEVMILMEDSFGLLTGLDVMAVANERGCFAEVWSMDRYASRGIIKAGVHSLRAADKDYNVLTSAPLALVDVTEDPKKWPEYGKAAGLKPKKKKKKK